MNKQHKDLIMKSREVIQMLIQDVWCEVRTKGSHV